jgi:hypothetical protein
MSPSNGEHERRSPRPPNNLESRTNAADSDYHCDEHVVTLHESEHTWIGFLADSTESCTMAVIEDICLEVDDSVWNGRRCLATSVMGGVTRKRRRGNSVLETAVQINEEALKNEGLDKIIPAEGKDFWSTSHIKRGSCFSLGERGKITISTVPYSVSGCPAGRWTTSSTAVGRSSAPMLRCTIVNIKKVGGNRLQLLSSSYRHPNR